MDPRQKNLSVVAFVFAGIINDILDSYSQFCWWWNTQSNPHCGIERIWFLSTANEQVESARLGSEAENITVRVISSASE